MAFRPLFRLATPLAKEEMTQAEELTEVERREEEIETGRVSATNLTSCRIEWKSP